MPRSAPLLTVALVAALAVRPPASLAQQRGRQQIPPGGPVVSSGRVLDQPLPDLRFTAFSAGDVKCIRPFTGQVTITVEIKNDATVAAVMPPTLPVLGGYWVGGWELSTHPGGVFIGAGPAPVPPREFKRGFV